jgi:spore germination protein KC
MNRKEIDEINLIQVLGIDYSETEYTVSALFNAGGGGDSQEGGGSPESEIVQGKGKTVYEAFEDLRLRSKKAISIAHTGYYLIGVDAAAHGVDYCLDFLSRDETIKMEAFVFIVQNMSAADFMESGVENKQQIHQDLEALNQKQMETLTRNDNTVVALVNEMEQSYSCILIPYLVSEEKGFLIDGYAVIKDMRLFDYLDNETSNAVNFIRNVVRRYPIYLNDGVGLLVTNANTKLNSNINNKVITVDIKMNYETMLKEVTTKEDIFTQDQLDKLTKEQDQYMIDMLTKAINFSISNKVDIFQLARLVENQNAKEWKTIGPDWSDYISNIQYQFKMNSRIVKSFILGNER